ncbi:MULTISPECIES: hypothetical protein [Catenuloplanes]|uniref:Cytochrome bd-type quinol oxidase subunit 2 n=1 Tax=Catenuloplanes niger TaxID=587534 RepID=A0AAE3ZN92_9ACTN|nr:hypothetical protein [Catenuloplanes niger]MDR7321876.1 cytochrome bd-type quinol oxidase subunit 2 [Catenuloplanes niger]
MVFEQFNARRLAVGAGVGLPLIALWTVLLSATIPYDFMVHFMSMVLLSLVPFAIVSFILIWARRHRSRPSHAHHCSECGQPIRHP